MARYVKINTVLEWLKIIAKAKSYTVKIELFYEYAKILRNNQRIAGFTSDVIEVVRCKDCKFNVANMEKDPLDCTDYSGDDIVCSYFLTDGLDPNDFCSRGKRKEGE